ncbi:MAG: RNA 2',3'-cyclic phosphodiesterase [Chloroflexi bacterium]|nr:RNA 2',3'-cyclic phosphodiesterase [Chloroflexota bacterium]
MESVRVFIAIELSSEILIALEKVQRQLEQEPGGEAARWTDKNSIHLTLKFLGEVPRERLDAITQAMRLACSRHAPFDLTVAGLGCFPNARRPRIVWAGVQEPTGDLLALQADIEQELARARFPKEERRFTPHLTIGRTRKTARPQEVEALGSLVAASPVGELGNMRVTGVALMRSDLRPQGAIYTQLFEASLCEG